MNSKRRRSAQLPPIGRMDSISELHSVQSACPPPPPEAMWIQGRSKLAAVNWGGQTNGCCIGCYCTARGAEALELPGQRRQALNYPFARRPNRSYFDSSSDYTMQFNPSRVELNEEQQRINMSALDCSGMLNEAKASDCSSRQFDKDESTGACVRDCCQPSAYHSCKWCRGQDTAITGDGPGRRRSAACARLLGSTTSTFQTVPPDNLSTSTRQQCSDDHLHSAKEPHRCESSGDCLPLALVSQADLLQRNQNNSQPYATDALDESQVHPPAHTGDTQLTEDHTSSLTDQNNNNNNSSNNNNNNKHNRKQDPHQKELEASLRQMLEEDKRKPPVGSMSRKKQAIPDEESDCPHMNWRGMAKRYGQMPRPYQSRLCWRLRQSCLCHVLTNSLHFLFPILSTFRDYSIPGDLFADLLTGFTIAVLHIPQGMAYGLLAGVEPIHGLYVSFVPVLVMALMSKSRHVSYGTFAIISMLLFNATESARLILRQQVASGQQLMIEQSVRQASSPGSTGSAGNLGGLVLTNNHQSANELIQQQQQLLKSLVAIRNRDELADQNNDTWLSNWLPVVTADVSQTSDFIMPSNIEILTCISILVGLIQMIMAMLRLGVLSLMFSDQLVSSFTTASAIHVITSQLGGLFDIETPFVPDGLFKVCRIWWATTSKLFFDGFNQYTALVSLASLVFLLSIKELVEPQLRRRFKSVTCLPSELLLMAFMIFSSWYFQFNSVYDVRIIGNVPTGLPSPQLPRLDLTSLVLNDAITVALVSFAMNLSLAQVYAKRYKYSMDPNQELFALGASNFVGSFFSCFPCASSLSRSAVQSNLNARSQLCSLFSCAIVVAIICYFAPILHDLPRSTLSCIIIVALKGILVQIKDLYENWRLSKLDAIVWIATFLSVMALGVTYGLVLGIVASLSMVFFRLLTPNHSILGQLPGTEIYVDRNAFIDCNEIEQVKIFRFNSALCYLNRTMFKTSVEESLPSIFRKNTFNLFCSNKQSNEPVNKVKFLIIDCSALAYCDYSGASTLIEIIEELALHKVSVYLAACPLKLITMVEKMQETKVLEQNVFPSISDAVSHARYLRRKDETSRSNSETDSADLRLVSVVTREPK